MSTREIVLADWFQARSGDKGDLATVALFAPTTALYSALVREVTAERVRALVGARMTGRVDRYEVPNLRAVHLVLHEALGGGAARSLRSDPLGKAYGSLLLRLRITVDEAELEGARRNRPPGA